MIWTEQGASRWKFAVCSLKRFEACTTAHRAGSIPLLSPAAEIESPLDISTFPMAISLKFGRCHLLTDMCSATKHKCFQGNVCYTEYDKRISELKTQFREHSFTSIFIEKRGQSHRARTLVGSNYCSERDWAGSESPRLGNPHLGVGSCSRQDAAKLLSYSVEFLTHAHSASFPLLRLNL